MELKIIDIPADVIYLICFELKPLVLQNLIRAGNRRIFNLTKDLKFESQYNNKWVHSLKERFLYDPLHGLMIALKLLRRKNFYPSNDLFLEELGYNYKMLRKDAIPFFIDQVTKTGKWSNCRNMDEYLQASLEIKDMTLFNIFYQYSDILNLSNPRILNLIESMCETGQLTNLRFLIWNYPQLRTILYENLNRILNSAIRNCHFYFKNTKDACMCIVNIFAISLSMAEEYILNADLLDIADKIRVLLNKNGFILNNNTLMKSALQSGNIDIIFLIRDIFGNITDVTTTDLMTFYNNTKEINQYHQLIEFLSSNKIKIKEIVYINCEYKLLTLKLYESGYFTIGKQNQIDVSLIKIILPGILYNDLNLATELIDYYSIKLDQINYLYSIIKSKIFSSFNSIDTKLLLIQRCIMDLQQPIIYRDFLFQTIANCDFICRIPVFKLLFDLIPETRFYDYILYLCRGQDFEFIEFVINYAYSHNESNKIYWDIVLLNNGCHTSKIKELKAQLININSIYI